MPTTVPFAATAARHYRERAAHYGWEPSPDHVLYRLMVHVAETDDQAYDDLVTGGMAGPREPFSTANAAVDNAAADAGYYGRDISTQRARHESYALDERVRRGQVILGSPDTILERIRWIKQEVGIGIIELNFQGLRQGKTEKAMELFAKKVLPVIHEW